MMQRFDDAIRQNQYICPLHQSDFHINRLFPATGIFLIWLFMAVSGITHHEIWRDEMRALSIAIESPGYTALPSALKNEGHPLLWYVVLKISYDIFQTTAVLPVLSLLFAAGIVILLLYRSNLPLLFCIPIIFGTWCLYEYGINCRNYGIAAFLLLLFADSYTHGPKRYIRHSLILALAAQANVYAAIMAMLAGCWMFISAPKNERLTFKTLLAAIILCLSFLLVVYVTAPDQNSLVMERQLMEMGNLHKIWDIGYGFDQIFYTSFEYKHGFVTTILLLSMLAFLPKPKTLAIVYLSAVIMAFFSLCLRYNYIHHQGMWIYFYIVLLCIHYKDIAAYIRERKGIGRYAVLIGLTAFLFVMASSTFRARQSYAYDLMSPKSDSKGAGLWLKKHCKNGDVIISEPDYVMEPVMYYHYYKFYLPREHRFNTYVHFTKANDSFLSLKTLIRTADSFSAQGKRPILVIREQLQFKDTIIRYTYGKHFVIDTASFTDLNKRFFIADSFRTNYFTDEQYYIYLKK
jgi:hypothetical protein